ncbi:thioesterase [Phycicoccus sp. BSK3Z-2]|uniref:Thioesterase n=1 Tax=Phycicoccus avicenniae TaxID=2828860 RepID=A0A941D7S0_9MICO|nr:hotdog domain-containing protein [Phycicoccus avicenniae]MBR7743669.1 thioesterase [Phycicoccus avicenniae]
MTIRTGLDAGVEHLVTDDDTAAALGSGDLAVLATPRLLAWCEAATCAAVHGVLGPGETTVGSRVSLEHRAASAVGDRVAVRAEVTGVEGRRVAFVVRAVGPDGAVLAEGAVERVVVDAVRFLARLGPGTTPA